MPTIEERLKMLEQEHTDFKKTVEQEHAELKKTIELQTIAIGALVNKTQLEKLNEKYDKIFEALITHDHLTNAQLAELREHQLEEGGKIVGLQTEMRQRLDGVDTRLDGMDKRLDGVDKRFDGVDKRFDAQDEKLNLILERLPKQ
ncbi:MAG TPA: hypothetical protein VHZ51_09205 [Ktedonobacteraceae bacterium]|nr:hypothetical protein [Ktedonobacteraceae bacterium]